MTTTEILGDVAEISNAGLPLERSLVCAGVSPAVAANFDSGAQAQRVRSAVGISHEHAEEPTTKASAIADRIAPAVESSYDDFLRSKTLLVPQTGIEPSEISPMAKDFQRDITKWALRRGRAAIFADCGLGKTPMGLWWGEQIARLGEVLIVCPLSVADQWVSEGKKFGVEVKYCRHEWEIDSAITVTNYEMLHNFDAGRFKGVVLDESSILKHYSGKLRNQIIEAFQNAPYKLACTATPAPNDHMELGNHAEFLGIMSRAEMLSMFFVHDGGDTSKWRVKGHAEKDFWKWVCSWAVMLRRPSDLGYCDDGYDLPPCEIKQIAVKVETADTEFFDFCRDQPLRALTLQERIRARRNSIKGRTAEVARLCNHSTAEQWVVCCGLNDEADELEDRINGAIQIRGTDKPEDKVRKLRKFIDGEARVLVSKDSMIAFGLNLQFCNNAVLCGLSDSWERFYQFIRRFWRFGQLKPVNIYVVTSTAEGAVVENIKRKEDDAQRMAKEMINNMHELTEQNIKGSVRTEDVYKEDYQHGEILRVSETGSVLEWEMFLGDCVEQVKRIWDNCVDYCIFSPPFASLYTYSASSRDMGNARNYSEFSEHFRFLLAELFRVMKPGRNVSVHCMNLPTTKSMHGFIGIRDFRGDMIRWFEAAGFIFHSEVCIWKDPVTAMQRTKALGLLWKQLKKDSAMSRQGIPDYLVTMRKPGENAGPIEHTAEEFPVARWQEWASPVWDDINPSDTLQYRSSREHDDERHICPLQLEVIRRAMVLWSNPGDLVLSPFAGIGSEGWIALGGSTKSGLTVDKPRRFIGVDLKESYYRQAVANLKAAIVERNKEDLFTRELVENATAVAQGITDIP